MTKFQWRLDRRTIHVVDPKSGVFHFTFDSSGDLYQQ